MLMVIEQVSRSGGYRGLTTGQNAPDRQPGTPEAFTYCYSLLKALQSSGGCHSRRYIKGSAHPPAGIMWALKPLQDTP
jgi:hypothetical protein